MGNVPGPFRAKEKTLGNEAEKRLAFILAATSTLSAQEVLKGRMQEVA